MDLLTNMATFNAMFPQLACTDKHSEKIGQLVMFANPEPSDGAMHKDGVFQIVGLQKDWRGNLCFRVRCVQFQGKPHSDTFGTVMPFYRVVYQEQN